MRSAHGERTIQGMSSADRIEPCRVVIVGGGIAALEAVLALHDLAAEQLRVTLIAPESEFTPRPLDGSRPPPRSPVDRLDLASFMDDHQGRFRRTAMLSIDSERHTVLCATGADEPYDVLIVAVGASVRPAFHHALTVGADSVAHDELLAGLEKGVLRSVAFIVPAGCSWPLPLYELALLLAEESRELSTNDIQLHLVTPEPAPLDMFGPRASAAVAALLRTARITLHRSADAGVHRGGRVDIGLARLDVTRAVALPRLDGPRLDGVPSDANGFIPVDEHGRVIGVDDIFAAGDATDGPIKEGGLACRQADAVAGQVAQSIVEGAISSTPVGPVLRGRLLTGDGNRFLRPAGEAREATLPFWWPQMEASGRYLAPYLEAQGLIALPPRDATDEVGFDVVLSLPIQAG